jgi:hypothetical protein
MSSGEQVLRDELLIVCVSFLGEEDIRLCCAVSKGFRTACCDEGIWEGLCREQWATKVRKFHLTPERRSKLLTSSPDSGPGGEGESRVGDVVGSPDLGLWKRLYREHEIDGAR